MNKSYGMLFVKKDVEASIYLRCLKISFLVLKWDNVQALFNSRISVKILTWIFGFEAMISGCILRVGSANGTGNLTYFWVEF